MSLEQAEIDSKIAQAVETVRYLRKIRGSVYPLASIELNNPIDPIVAVDDAQGLGTASSAYLIDSIAGESAEPQRNRFLETLAELQTKYCGYKEASTVPDSFKPPLSQRLAILLEYYRVIVTMEAIPNTGVSRLECILGQSNFFAMPFCNFLQERLGVLSPLSYDYFKTCLCQRFIQTRTSAPVFTLRPLVLSLSPDLDPLPGEGQHSSVFDNTVDEIAIVTDQDSSHRTRRASCKAASALYPAKFIHGFTRYK